MKTRPYFLDEVRKLIDDSRVEVRWARDRYRPVAASSLKTEAFAIFAGLVRKIRFASHGAG